jgi:acyl-CoA synthetase (AMP-forming)/AMP-acid ligase II
MIPRLLQMAASQPTAPFIFYEDAVWDFNSVADLALRGATWLAGQGIDPGDKIVIAVSNRPLFLFYWFAAVARGAVAVPVSHDTFGDSLRYAAQQSEAKMVLTEDQEAARISDDLSALPVRVVSVADETDFAVQISACAAASVAPVADHAAVAILYTSGTTGQPKGVIIPNRSYLAIGEKITQAIGITQSDRILTFLPLHHANPQMYSILSALTVGCSVVIIKRFSATSFHQQVEKYRPTGFTYVGTVLSILEKTIIDTLGTSLKWCVGGGAPRAVWEAIGARLGVEVHELYGMTETGGMVTINSSARNRFGSVGAVRDDFDVAVLGDDDQPLPAGAIGEIAVRPKIPFVMTSGYFNKPVETLEAMQNLWFHTGDIGRFDADGFLFFEGRKKELIRRAGEMISPVEIELAALKHPQIADCAAVGVKDAILEEEIKLAVVSHGQLQAEDIASFLRKSLQKHMIPRYIEFVGEIPKTPTQKIQRFKLTTNSAQTVDLKAIKTSPACPSLSKPEL